MSKLREGYKQTKVGVIPEEWEVVRLGDVFERVTRKNINNNTNVLTISAHQGLINQEDFFNKSIASKDLSGYILLKKGEFAYNKSYSSGYPMGAFKRLNFYDEGVLSSLYIYFKIKKDNSDFYEQYFEAGLMNKEIYKIAQEGARNHGLLNMSIKEFFNDMLIIKPPLKEQQKISQILSTWDSAISKQETLIKAKEQLKKGLMQKLLSGEVRFEGFDGEWEEVRLGDLFEERSRRYKDLKSEEIEQYCELLSVGINSGITKRSENDAKDNSSSDKRNYKILNKNDIAYNTMRMWQGASGVSILKGIVSPAYTIVYLKDDNYIEFFGLLFKMHRVIFDFYRYSQGMTSDTWNLKYPHFSEVKVKIPTKKQEQQKIAQVLSTADKEIDLLKNELETLKEQKRGLMQRLLSGDVRVKV